MLKKCHIASGNSLLYFFIQCDAIPTWAPSFDRHSKNSGLHNLLIFEQGVARALSVIQRKASREPLMIPFEWGPFSQLFDAQIFDDSNVKTDRSGGHEFSTKNLSSQEGHGGLDYLHTPDYSVAIADMSFNHEKKFQIIQNDLIRLFFCFDISTDIRVGDRRLPRVLENTAGLIATTAGDMIEEKMAARHQQVFVSIACRQRWLEKTLGFRFADDLMGDHAHMAPLTGHSTINFSPELRLAARDMIAFRPRRQLRAEFVSAKAREIIIRALNEVQLAENEPASRLSDRDVEAIQSAGEILEASLALPPDIEALSRRIGINRTKLFYGFKTLYGTSVTRFVEIRRMDWAARLLTETDMSVAAIAFEVGYGHAANFSTRFKACFGCTPRQFRMRAG